MANAAQLSSFKDACTAVSANTSRGGRRVLYQGVHEAHVPEAGRRGRRRVAVAVARCVLAQLLRGRSLCWRCSSAAPPPRIFSSISM